MSRRKRKGKYNENQAEIMEAVYNRCIENERVRETKRRLYTKQGRFDAAMVRLDAFEASDKFRGATTLGSVITSHEEIGSLASSCRRKLDHACQKLRRTGYGHLVRVLLLIAKNGKNREESICELMKDYTTGRKRVISGTEIGSANSGALKGAKKG